MAKLKTGETMPDFTYDTPFQAGVALSDTARRVAGRTALVFLRYYGCTLCQYDLHRYAKEYEKIAATGGQMLVVLQSDPKKLAEQLKPGDLPFDIVCDPTARLYRQLDIQPAANQAGLADAGTLLKIAKAKAGGFTHGDYEGNELQLPAVFVFTPDLTLTHVHYGKSAGDVPDPNALAALLG